jgi:hypothetical protein
MTSHVYEKVAKQATVPAGLAIPCWVFFNLLPPRVQEATTTRRDVHRFDENSANNISYSVPMRIAALGRTCSRHTAAAAGGLRNTSTRQGPTLSRWCLGQNARRVRSALGVYALDN